MIFVGFFITTGVTVLEKAKEYRRERQTGTLRQTMQYADPTKDLGSTYMVKKVAAVHASLNTPTELSFFNPVFE